MNIKKLIIKLTHIYFNNENFSTFFLLRSLLTCKFRFLIKYKSHVSYLI